MFIPSRTFSALFIIAALIHAAFALPAPAPSGSLALQKLYKRRNKYPCKKGKVNELHKKTTEADPTKKKCWKPCLVSSIEPDKDASDYKCDEWLVDVEKCMREAAYCG